MFPEKCQRCGGTLEVNGLKVHTVSMFNKEEICMSCKEREKKHPMYRKAVEVDREHIKNGDYNFEGIGCPPELYEKEGNETKKVVKATTIYFTTSDGPDATQFDTQDVAELLELFTFFVNENKFVLKSVDDVEFVDLFE